ncbi:hypothetical protein M758_3G037700 [Ceratodon purpureus]|nr:hypothetical protein M758_3G037700 [Ceratodon purpureus]
MAAMTWPLDVNVQMHLRRCCKLSAARMTAIVLLINLGLITSIAADSGWLPSFEPILGTSKGGTRIRVHSTGSPRPLSDYFLQLGFNGETLAADHIGVINDTMVESQFIMPNIPSGMGTKGVVELSFSGSGAPYVGIGSFIFYDSDQLESEGLSGPDKDGLLALNPTVFPDNVESLNWKQIKPSCGFRDGTVAPAIHAHPNDNGGSGGSAELHIQCDEGASSVSLNEQEYFSILPSGTKHAQVVMESMVPAKESVSYEANEEEIPRRRLSSGPICTSTDTGMGLTIMVTYPSLSMDPVNATVNNGVTYIGLGGPITYLIRIIITTPGVYSVTSMYPSCAGGSPAGSFNVSAAPSPTYSYVSTTFTPGGYAPGFPVPFNIRSADSAGIVPSAQIQGPCPFSVNLKQLDPSTGISYPVPFTISSQLGGNWKVVSVPTRFLPVTGNISSQPLQFILFCHIILLLKQGQ